MRRLLTLLFIVFAIASTSFAQNTYLGPINYVTTTGDSTSWTTIAPSTLDTVAFRLTEGLTPSDTTWRNQFGKASMILFGVDVQTMVEYPDSQVMATPHFIVNGVLSMPSDSARMTPTPVDSATTVGAYSAAFVVSDSAGMRIRNYSSSETVTYRAWWRALWFYTGKGGFRSNAGK